jgi:hypothetical protein
MLLDGLQVLGRAAIVLKHVFGGGGGGKVSERVLVCRLDEVERVKIELDLFGCLNEELDRRVLIREG